MLWGVGAVLAAVPVAGGGQTVDRDGTVHVPAIAIPESTLLGPATREQLRRQRAPGPQPQPQVAPRSCPSMAGASNDQVSAIRECEAQAFYVSPAYHRLQALFDVSITDQTIGGVRTEVVEPRGGVAPVNRKRVLINVHGGAFAGGARTLSRIESMPIAATGRIKVISIDYRQGPDFAFPAASEDVAAVYRQLIKSYDPRNIGIYGCSAGGLLTAQSIAWFLKEKLPLPGAIGMLCEGGAYWTEGDSSRMVYDTSQHTYAVNPYLAHVDPNDPLVFPARSAEVLAKFPPTLLVTATRDFALSSTVYTHSRLVALGVPAELHVWEGLPHAFHMDPDLPESREVYDAVVRFFDKRLGK
ncbi:alpha/beta hydrolase [Sphingomonas sp.]|uniref:alpha/beta hydrolase n=1 Tax=Sphingomonas sp. TaxID=28214 RepID=UPI002C6959AD|nr:alpha/beta hydrolase fold domain-containing protein [Sphingomonas sp.]HWK36547.1 alpha/beta hydrolase fold domain-containing protein [Sphingomonas sp.]